MDRVPADDFVSRVEQLPPGGRIEGRAWINHENAVGAMPVEVTRGVGERADVWTLVAHHIAPH